MYVFVYGKIGPEKNYGQSQQHCEIFWSELSLKNNGG